MSLAALYAPLQSNIKVIVESVDVLVEDRRIRSIKQHHGGFGSWFHDSALHSRITNFKAASDALSNCCTKLTIVASKNPTAASLESLLAELSQNVDLLGRSYLCILDCELGNPLFKAISLYVRNELSEVSNLAEILAAGDVESARSATGMVWSVNDQIQKVPLQNKAAYRRHKMERIGVIKETAEEFEGYLKSAEREGKEEEPSATEDGDDEEKDDDAFDDDDFADDTEYDIEELGAVRACVSAMRISEQALKAGLIVMTSVADKISTAASASASAAPKPPASDSAVTAAETPPPAPIEAKKTSSASSWNCSEWVATLSTSCETIESAVIDLGAELYPPLVVSTVRTQLSHLRTTLDAYVGLLSVGMEHHNEEASLKAVADLQTALHELAETAGSF